MGETTNGELLESLNQSQREAVEYCYGPQLVIAGAGSGKTRVLTYKIAYLLQRGLRPWNILALTFTNKAANEMKQRIGFLVGQDQAMRLNMGTFHSVFARILRNEADYVGYENNYTIYDDHDSRSLISTIIKEMGLDDKIYKPASVQNKISMAKNHLVTADDYGRFNEFIERDKRDRMVAMPNIFHAYSLRCLKANAMDFDDLLLNTYILFRDNKEIKEKYAARFAYVLVDEYQDTNYAQQCIIRLLTEKRRQLCVVGDDAQSIYAFRGANIDNMLDFNTIYDDCRIFKLEQNYRSTQNIVRAANSLIQHNVRQIKKDVFSRNEAGEKIVLRNAYSDKEEAAIVCKEIKRLKKEDSCGYGAFCILYRTNAQSRNFEDEFRKQSIPYRIYGGLSFYQRKEIKDIVAYFRLVANPNDEEALKRIINYPARGIGSTTLSKIVAAAQQQKASLWDIVKDPCANGVQANKGTLAKIDSFRALVQSFIDKRDNFDAFELGMAILTDSGIEADILADNTPEGLARQDNVGEFKSTLRDFVDTKLEEGNANETSISHFIQETALLTDQDSDGEETADRVSMMTIHASKGLEFPSVFVVGLEENIFPNLRSCGTPRELEEERRLLYVAITRAEKHCILTCAKNRYMYGSMAFNPPSRFINEIDPALVDSNMEKTWAAKEPGIPWDRDAENGLASGSSPRNILKKPALLSSEKSQVSSIRKVSRGNGAVCINPQFKSVSRKPIASAKSKSSDGNHTLAEGVVIEHQRFGIGKVLKVEGVGENEKATVQFQNAGTKQLLLKFARYKVIG